MKARDYTVYNVSIKDIELNKHNPARRTEGKTLEALQTALDVQGMVEPIKLTRDFEIIDGHRRYSAAVLLGWEEVPVIFMDGEDGAMFRMLNSTSKPITRTQYEDIYESVFNSGTAAEYAMIPKGLMKKFNKVRKELGDELYVKIKRTYKVSPTSVYECANIAKKYLPNYSLPQLADAIGEKRKQSYVKNIDAAELKDNDTKAKELAAELSLRHLKVVDEPSAV